MRASCFRRGKHWYVDYEDSRSGRRVRKTIGHSKAEAQAVLAKIETEIIEKGYFEKKVLPRVLFEDFVPEYLGIVQNRKSFRAYEHRLRRMTVRFKGMLLTEITAYAIEQYKVARSNEAVLKTNRTVTPAEVNHDLTVLKSFFNTAIKAGKASINPVRGLKMFKVNNFSHTRYLDQKEVQALQAACKDGPPYLGPLVTVALHTGMRKGELLNLKWNDVDYSSNLLHIPHVPHISAWKSSNYPSASISGGR